MSKKRKIKMEHIDRLSRGKKSGVNIGSRSVDHNLKPHERDIYERSLKKGFLEIDERSRDNLKNIWGKTCLVKQWKLIVLEKSEDRMGGKVYIENVEVFSGSLVGAKKYVKTILPKSL